jgi:hypothetical protein
MNNFLLFIFRFLLAKPPSRNLVAPTVKLKDSKKGKTALVLGNGPSIDYLKTDILKNYVDDIYCVNEFYDLRIASEIKCNNYVLSDPLSFATPDFSLPESLLDFLRKNDAELFLPHWSASAFYDLTKENSIYYFDDRERFWLNRKISPVKPRNYASVTLYKALSIACYRGYSTIYVLGLDNTEFLSYVGTHENITFHNSESYGGQSSVKEAVSMKDVFHSGMAGRMQSYAHLFGDLNKFKEFNIINLDQSSLTDTFPKIELSHDLSVSRR